MHLLEFSDAPQRHRVQIQPGTGRVLVDGEAVTIHREGDDTFIASTGKSAERLHAVADGDIVHVQFRGRTWRIEHVDPTLAAATGSAASIGASHAPMPGVVISLHASVGQRISRGDPLLVIESMKLQTTLSAACDGLVGQLPFEVGQTFQRGAVLAVVTPGEVAA